MLSPEYISSTPESVSAAQTVSLEVGNIPGKEVLKQIVFLGNEFAQQRKKIEQIFLDTQTNKKIDCILNERLLYLYSPNSIHSFFASVSADTHLMKVSAELWDMENTKLVRHPLLPRLTELFTASISFFKQTGHPVELIQGRWVPPFKRESQLSTNYSLFNKEVNAGASNEQAAFKTPTGKIAERLGYSHIRSCEVDEHDNVTVLFSRPVSR